MRDKRTKDNQHHKPRIIPLYAIIFIAVVNLAGIIGLNIKYTQSLFRFLTPFTLITVTGILLAYHKNRNRLFFFFTILTTCLGLTVEIIGVNTGLIFGNYQYGATLGWKILNTPIVIGVNWLMLGYMGTSIAMKINRKLVFQVLIGALLMVLLDIFMEPVAGKYNLWSWKSGSIPVLNYIGWYLLSSIIVFLGIKLKVNPDNQVTIPVYIIQLFFFLTLNIIDRL